MARMIDGDKLVENLRLIATCWSISPFVSKEQHCGAVDILREVERAVKEAPTLTPPNEALTMGDAKKERYIWFTPLNDWAKVTPFGVLFFGSEELMTWETLCEEWGYRFKAYRRPPEGEA